MYINGTSLIRTRFAPSPTGYLHIGGARTALFNYMFAKRYGGTFLIRIDDTDKVRNIEAAVKPIIDGLRWLGLTPFDGPIYQSSRRQHYIDVAEGLIKLGVAYPEPPATENHQSEKPYRGINRNLSSERAFNLYDDTGWCVRYKVPEDETIILDDLVRGEVTWNTKYLGDPVILRTGGDPTYNFATAVDDAEMKITHVIRGEEHLSNTPIQLLLMSELGYVPPFYAHLPFVCEPNSTKKLSKRNTDKFITPEITTKLQALGFTTTEIKERIELNPTSLSFYEALGYKPQAVANYLAKLGWSLDGETEIMSMKEMIKGFSLKDVSESPAQFNPQKLLWVNTEHMHDDDYDTRARRCSEFLVHAKKVEHPVKKKTMDKIRQIVELCEGRIKKYSDILNFPYLLEMPFYNMPDVVKHLNHQIRPVLDLLTQSLKFVPKWTASEIEKHVKDYAQQYGIEASKFVYALRIGTSGCMIGPSLFEMMEFFGQEECIRRMGIALKTPCPRDCEAAL